MSDDYNWEADAAGSWRDAIAEIKRQVKTGAPLPTSGYSASRPCTCPRCRERTIQQCLKKSSA